MKKCRATRVGLWVFLAGFAGASISFGAQDPGMILGSPSESSNLVTFTLSTKPGVSYTIQASSNLVDWVAVGTNADPCITRTITISNRPDGPSYYRAARGPLPLPRGGLVAKGNIAFSGGAYLDSFDSSDTNYSNPDGSYNHDKAKDNAMALTDMNATGAISLNGGYIASAVITGPGGTVTLSGGAAVGDIAWITSSNTGIEPGHSRNSANVQINDVAAPSFGAFSISLPSGTVGGTNYTYVATNGNYMVPSLGISGGKSMVVNGNAVIYCTSTANCVSVSGSGFIYITPGSSLTLYMAGSSTISGGGVVNGNLRADTFYIYGLPTCTAMTYSGSATLYAVVDVPEAILTFAGGQGWCGAGTANSFSISGSSGVHYDER